MKKIILLCISIAFMSCGTSKTIRASKKVIKGDWSLTSINYNTPGTYNVTLLNDASKACFESSTWHFVPNNFTGTYTIKGDNCSIGSRYFVFSIKEIDQQTGLYDFLLKPTNAKGKSETNQGYRFSLKALSETDMLWQQTVQVEGKPFIINMNFTKQ